MCEFSIPIDVSYFLIKVLRIPGKAVLCLQQTNLGNGSLLQSDSLSGKNGGTG